MKKIGFLLLAVSLHCSAEEGAEDKKLNLEAIPGTISTEDREIEVSPGEAAILKTAEHIIKDVKLGDQKAKSPYVTSIERKQRKKFDKNPKQSRPVKECIKPDGVLDNEVQACVQGFIEPYWNSETE